MISINPSLGITNFRVGETVSGRVNWNLNETPQELILNLIWHTVGRGTEDAESVDRLVILSHSKTGEAEFNLKIPELGPWSYSGNLISIVWLIEVVTNPTIDKSELGIIVGPDAQEVVLRATKE